MNDKLYKTYIIQMSGLILVCIVGKFCRVHIFTFFFTCGGQLVNICTHENLLHVQQDGRVGREVRGFTCPCGSTIDTRQTDSLACGVVCAPSFQASLWPGGCVCSFI